MDCDPFIYAGLRVLLRIAKYHTSRPAIRKRAPPYIGGVLRCARTYSKAKRCAFLLTKYGESFAAMTGGSAGSTIDIDEFGNIRTQT